MKKVKPSALQKERKKGIERSKKYVDPNSSHSHFSEIEADTYASNKTSPESMKAALKDVNKFFNPQDIKHLSNNVKTANNYNSKVNSEIIQKNNHWDEGLNVTREKLLKAYNNKRTREQMPDKYRRHAQLVKKSLDNYTPQTAHLCVKSYTDKSNAPIKTNTKKSKQDLKDYADNLKSTSAKESEKRIQALDDKKLQSNPAYK